VNYGDLLIGLPILWQGLAAFVPNASAIISLHPLALAGWVGLLVTSINLLPAGQLDGGHVFRSLFRDGSRFVSYAAVVFLALVGIFTLYLGWLLFAALIILLGVRHPPPLNDVSPLGVRRYLIGIFVVAVLVGGFVLVPISTPADSFALEKPIATHVSGTPFGVNSDIQVVVANHDPVVHAYTLSANVTSVTQNNTPLTGVGLSSFLGNSSWTIVLPSGNVTFDGVGSWTLPSADFLSIPMGSIDTITVVYTNPRAAVLEVAFVAAQYCNESGGGPSSPQSVQVY
jgi:hypothetical protein